jgi:hypothetical protein
VIAIAVGYDALVQSRLVDRPEVTAEVTADA